MIIIHSVKVPKVTPFQTTPNAYLGTWVTNQRKAQDTLTPERIERLNALGFIWDALTEKWEEGFSKLQQFKEREGNCRVLNVHKEACLWRTSWAVASSPTTRIRLATSSTELCLQTPQVMLSWWSGIVLSWVKVFFYLVRIVGFRVIAPHR